MSGLTSAANMVKRRPSTLRLLRMRWIWGSLTSTAPATMPVDASQGRATHEAHAQKLRMLRDATPHITRTDAQRYGYHGYRGYHGGDGLRRAEQGRGRRVGRQTLGMGAERLH